MKLEVATGEIDLSTAVTCTGLLEFAGGLVFVVPDPLDYGFLRAEDFRFWLRAETPDDFLPYISS
jgi:hypothetical protein